MKEVSLLDLLKSGAHFGHSTSRWNPKMKPYIFAARSGIHILDLEKTKQALIKAAAFAKDVASKGGTILFIGTKRQSKEAVQAAAKAAGMPYINVRWLGGTFTNFRTIQRTIRKLERLEGLKATGELQEKYTKKERLLVEREIEKLKKLFEGIQDMRRLPEAIFVTDVKHEDIAVKEAKLSKIKVIGIVDSNGNPESVDYVVPCNDDSSKAIQLVCQIMAEAVTEGRSLQPQPAAKETAAAPATPATKN